jgi:hypothetical protein
VIRGESSGFDGGCAVMAAVICARIEIRVKMIGFCLGFDDGEIYG